MDVEQQLGANIARVQLRISGLRRLPPGAPGSLCMTALAVRPRGMLAAVDQDNLQAPGRLDQVGRLLGELTGPCGNGEIFAWADPGDARAVPGVVLGRIGSAGLLDGPDLGADASVPGDAAGLASRLQEIGEPAADDAVTALASMSMAYRTPGRCTEEQARVLFARLARLLVPARWWANASRGGWNPVTGHTFDTVVIGAGGGVIATILAYDED
jgi:hypothetical protein